MKSWKSLVCIRLNCICNFTKEDHIPTGHFHHPVVNSCCQGIRSLRCTWNGTPSAWCTAAAFFRFWPHEKGNILRRCYGWWTCPGPNSAPFQVVHIMLLLRAPVERPGLIYELEKCLIRVVWVNVFVFSQANGFFWPFHQAEQKALKLVELNSVIYASAVRVRSVEKLDEI